MLDFFVVVHFFELFSTADVKRLRLKLKKKKINAYNFYLFARLLTKKNFNRLNDLKYANELIR